MLKHTMILMLFGWSLLLPGLLTAADQPSSESVAQAIDRSLWRDTIEASVPPCDDATYLRRIMLDVVGRPATPGEITAFGLNPDDTRRADIIERLLQSDDYGQNWSHYWRDAIFRRATNMRAGIVRPAFGDWMAEQLNEGHGWDEITTSLLTASGPVNDNGAAALLFAHEGVAEEVSAEASRLFLGIQIQCANCHDHPWDSWKRDQFHQFTAFFPRVSVQRTRGSDNLFDFEITSVNASRNRNSFASRFLLTRLDRNRDQIITDSEAKGSPLARIFTGPARDLIDRNGDGKLTIEEIATAQPPERPGQGSIEHFMPDLNDPASEGIRIDPAFFLSTDKVPEGLSDAERRQLAAQYITSSENPWFAKALVNRIWYEMMGTAFYLPIDDIGPDRECMHEEALNLLSNGFQKNDYDVRWLIRTIALTQTYQRAPSNTADGFARCEPIRLRSDQLYAALCQTLGVTGLPLRPADGRRSPYEMQRLDPGQEEFARVFGFDPSTPRDELTGSIPEALFLMNSPMLSQIIASRGEQNVLTRISTQVLGEEDVVRELFLTAVGREPEEGELKIATDHLMGISNFREGLEDLLWALVNSPEFASRR
jgi:hypothetical protein